MDSTAATTTLQAAASLFNAFAWAKMVPVLAFGFGAVMVYWMLAKAQRADPDFRAIDFMRDDSGKPSWKRLVGTCAFIVHSILIWLQQIDGSMTWNDMALYALTWSGSVVLIEGLRIMRGVPPAEKQDGS